MSGATHGTLRLSKLAILTVAVLATSWGNAHAATKYCGGLDCKTYVRGQKLDDASTVSTAVGSNTEAPSTDDLADGGYSISVDGEVVAGSKKLADAQRKVDKQLDAVDIQVKLGGRKSKFPCLHELPGLGGCRRSQDFRREGRTEGRALGDSAIAATGFSRLDHAR